MPDCMQMSLLIKNCIIISEHRPRLTSVLISQGKIHAIGDIQKAEKIYDARKKVLLPGMIDAHVHMREPGNPDKETWETGTKAAARGGVTTVLDMPNSYPPCMSAEDLERKRRHVTSWVNFGFYLGVSPENVSLLHKMKGCVGFKLYMGSTTGDLAIEDEDIMYKAFASKRLIAVHAEDGRMARHFMEDHLADPREPESIPILHNSLRPNICSELALSKAIILAKHTKGTLYVAHVSTKEEVALLKKAKQEAKAYGFRVYAEVCPHHLLLTQDSIQTGVGKVNPPLRTHEDRVALWQGLHAGIIDVIASDHSPHTWKEKQGRYIETPSGISGIESTLPLLLDCVNARKLTLTEVQQFTAENPAKIFGLKTKGKIAPGFDADLVLVDMDFEKPLLALDFQSKAKFTPFDGKMTKGWPAATFVNGEIVFEHVLGKDYFYTANGKEILY